MGRDTSQHVGESQTHNADLKKDHAQKYVLNDATYIEVTIMGLPSGEGGQVVGTSGRLWGPSRDLGCWNVWIPVVI